MTWKTSTYTWQWLSGFKYPNIFFNLLKKQNPNEQRNTSKPRKLRTNNSSTKLACALIQQLILISKVVKSCWDNVHFNVCFSKATLSSCTVFRQTWKHLCFFSFFFFFLSLVSSFYYVKLKKYIQSCDIHCEQGRPFLMASSNPCYLCWLAQEASAQSSWDWFTDDPHWVMVTGSFLRERAGENQALPQYFPCMEGWQGRARDCFWNSSYCYAKTKN